MVINELSATVVAILSATVVAILLVGGMGYLAYVFFKKFRWIIKYKIFRRPHKEKDVKQLIQYIDARMSAEDIESLILLDPKNRRTLSQVKELLFVYSELEEIERRGNK